MGKFLRILLVLFVMPFVLKAQAPADTAYSVDELFAVSLEELLSLKVESASKKEESSFETPLSVTVVTATEIANSGATTIEEIFRLVPGMIVRQESNGNFDVHVRGLDNVPPSNFTFFSENTMTLVLLDGQKMYNHLNGGVFWETLPIGVNDIEKIEIVRGPSTALYGPNAATGVINIVTKKADKDNIHATAKLQSGMYNTNVGSVSTTFKKDKLGVRLSTNYDVRNRFEDKYYDFYTKRYVDSDSLIDYLSGKPYSSYGSRWGEGNQSKSKFGIYSTLSYEFKDSVKVDVHLSTQNSSSENVFMESTGTPYLTRLSSMNSVGVNSTIKNLRVSGSHQFGQQDVSKGNDTQRPFNVNISDALVEYQYKFKDRVLLQPGVSFQQAIYNDLPNIDTLKDQRGVLNAKQQVQNIAYYLRSEYNPIEKLRLIAALRADKYQTPDTTYLSWQLGATYSVNENNMVRYVFSRANRGPFIADLFTNYTDKSVGLINFMGNPNIKLASVQQHEIGYRSKISNKFSVDVEVFHVRSKNFSGFESNYFAILDSSTGAIQSDLKYRNYSVEVEQLGATAMLCFNPNKKIGVKGFATVQNTKLANLEVYNPTIPLFIPQEPTVLAESAHKNTPTVYGGLIVDAKLTRKLLLNTNMYFYSSQVYKYRIDETTVPSNMIWNVVAKYNVFKQHVVFLNVRNAFNTNKREFGFIDRSKAMVLGGLELNF